MKIELKPDHAHDDAALKAATGRGYAEWFALLDAAGGPGKGRRELGSLLNTTHGLDPWWCTTVNIEYEAARGVVDKDGRPKGYMVCATKSIKAPPAACFDAFASAASLDRWLGPGTELDFRDGGSLRNADGNQATVRKISPGKTLRLVWEQPGAAAGSPVEVKFQPAGAKTTVMVSHDRLQGRAEADGFRVAWGEALQRLKVVLETS